MQLAALRFNTNTWRTMSEKGLALQDVLAELYAHVMCLDVKASVPLARLVASLADVEHRLAVGTSEKTQLAGLVGLFMSTKPALLAAMA